MTSQAFISGCYHFYRVLDLCSSLFWLLWSSGCKHLHLFLQPCALASHFSFFFCGGYIVCGWCMHVCVRPVRDLCNSVTPLPIALRQGLSLNWKCGISARLFFGSACFLLLSVGFTSMYSTLNFSWKYWGVEPRSSWFPVSAFTHSASSLVPCLGLSKESDRLQRRVRELL